MTDHVAIYLAKQRVVECARVWRCHRTSDADLREASDADLRSAVDALLAELAKRPSVDRDRAIATWIRRPELREEWESTGNGQPTALWLADRIERGEVPS